MAISYIGAGLPVTNNGGANPTPPLPTGLTAGSSVMVMSFYSRAAVDESIAAPAGWTVITNTRDASGLLAAWYRVYQSGDTNPTLTRTNFSGGTGGDTLACQIAAWDGVDPSNVLGASGSVASNGAAANIGPIPGITLAASGTVVVIGGKQDDWTSVATLTGDSLTWAEIGEPDSTSGADAGMVWDYAIDPGSGTTVTNKTFSVTGGNSVPGRGVMFSLNVYVPPAVQTKVIIIS